MLQCIGMQSKEGSVDHNLFLPCSINWIDVFSNSTSYEYLCDARWCDQAAIMNHIGLHVTMEGCLCSMFHISCLRFELFAIARIRSESRVARGELSPKCGPFNCIRDSHLPLTLAESGHLPDPASADYHVEYDLG